MLLTPAELKVVVATLSKRRAWLRKALEDNGLDTEVRAENISTLRLLDGAMQKLASTSGPASKKAPNSTPMVMPTCIKEVRVLVAEDNAESAELLMDLLKDMNLVMIDEAKDGMEAFDKIKRAETPYHIILCDWDMPEISGLDVHSKAKASNTLRGAHFIMVTGVTDAPRIKQAAQQGINDYIVKPIDFQILKTKIHKALGLEEQS